jgi:hypothetical protein
LDREFFVVVSSFFYVPALKIAAALALFLPRDCWPDRQCCLVALRTHAFGKVLTHSVLTARCSIYTLREEKKRKKN